MSQHDMVVDNADGLTVRTDFNAAVQALVTCSSGAVAPATPFPGMLWLDLSAGVDGVLRQRNQGNTTWLPVLLPPEFRFGEADLFFGARLSPNRFVWNDKIDGSGLDIMTLREDGHLSVAGAGASPVAAGDVPTKGYVDGLVVPVGAVMYFAMTAPPVNWLKANGASLLRTDFPALFAQISTTYGAANSSHFTIPDLRGEFIRGFDDGRGVDAGRAFGSAQADQFASHTHPASSGYQSNSHYHTFSASTSSAGSHAHDVTVRARKAGAPTQAGGVAIGDLDMTSYTTAANNYAQTAAAHTHTISGSTAYANADHYHAITVGAAGGADTRPRNIAQLACIKYQ